jgi:DNA-directed RNA polymerase II subunit RPB1
MSSSFIPTSELSKVKFFVLDENDNNVEACVDIVNKELFRNNMPFDNGVYDSRLGTTDNSYLCQTCFLNKNLCSGHFGKIQTPYPFLSPLFKREVLKWLKVICFKCGECIVNIKKKSLEKTQLLNEAVKLSRSSTQKHIKCSHCEEIHPIVERDTKDHLKINIKYDEIIRRLLNTEIETVLSKISDETVLKLGKSLDSHPRKFVLRTLRVPPVSIRPDIKKIKGGRSNNNDLTTILKNMVALLEKLPPVLDEEMIKKNMINLDNIEMHYYNLIKDVPSGNSNRLQTNTGSSLSSITSRFAKKTGRIRKNILGKRTTYMARSVISVDNIKAYQVGVPKSVAEKIVIPEVVQYYNKEKLMINFNNKDKQYPGCLKVVKKNGKEYYVGAISDSFILEEGDTIYRHLMDGDIICMNRAPTLQASSISGHIVYIVDKGDTFRLSPNITDSFYGGDFDGDAMMAIFPHSEASKNEAWHLAGIPNWCISLKDGSPSVGVYHDGLIGIFEFTKNGTNINKYNSFRLLSTNDSVYNSFLELDAGPKDSVRSHDLVSMLLPPINYKKNAGFFKPEYASYIKYDPEDVKVDISRGKLIKGRLDKKSIGQGVSGSIFHVLYNEYGSEVALNLIFNIQQMTNIFLMHKGATLTYDDITVSKSALSKIHKQTQVILMEAEQIIQDYKKGKIVPPLGTTVKQFFEEQQLSILNLGDDFLRPVFEDIKHEDNNLFKLIVSGSKGKLTNLLQISSSIGQASIGGERPVKLFDYERTCPYYHRFDETPQNRGFVSESYTSGVDMVSFIFQSMEARYSIINKALSTSITGEQNRKSVKNLESLIADNYRKVSTSNTIIQFLFGNDGVDVRNNENVHFPYVFISNEEFESNWRCKLENLKKEFRNKEVLNCLDEEWAVISKDRKEYREMFIGIELQNTKNKMLDDSKLLSVNTKRIFEDTCYNFSEEVDANTESINPIVIVERINNLCEDIKYAHYNEFQMNKRMEIPEYVKTSFKLLEINIRAHLFTKKIVEKNIPLKILDICINRIKHTFKKSLIDYGMPVGIITAQSISEPMTQYVLDSHHRTGAGGTKTDFLGRMKEILGVKATHKMKTPSMTIHIKDEFMKDDFKVQSIANHIEMMKLKQFISSAQIFFESFMEIKHPEYIEENQMIEQFIKHNPVMKSKIPADLMKWCIRLVIDKEKLIEKNMKLETICYKLFELNNNLFIVNNSENSGGDIIVRIYIRASNFKKTQTVNINLMEQFLNINILNAIIRGVDGIRSTSTAGKLARSKIMDDGSIIKENKNVIITDGTNLPEILANEFVDPYQTKSDSIQEIYQMLGIEAANNAIVIELSSMMPSAHSKYYRVYSDSMTSTGVPTSIDRQGIQNREKNNSLLLLSNSHPLQELENVAINSTMADCQRSVSPALMVGSVPKQCSNFNRVIINKQFIQENVQNLDSQLLDL